MLSSANTSVSELHTSLHVVHSFLDQRQVAELPSLPSVPKSDPSILISKNNGDPAKLLLAAQILEQSYRDHKDKWQRTVVEAQNSLKAADLGLFNAEMYLASVQNFLIEKGHLKQERVYKRSDSTGIAGSCSFDITQSSVLSS